MDHCDQPKAMMVQLALSDETQKYFQSCTYNSQFVQRIFLRLVNNLKTLFRKLAANFPKGNECNHFRKDNFLNNKIDNIIRRRLNQKLKEANEWDTANIKITLMILPKGRDWGDVNEQKNTYLKLFKSLPT